MLCADFTQASKTRQATLTVYALVNGSRMGATSQPVADKREARRVALSQGAKPWNF
jgi:hypothetical protein